MRAAPTPTGARTNCIVCGRAFPQRDLRPWVSVRPSISALVAQDHPCWVEGRSICHEDLARYRRLYVERMREQERGELSDLEIPAEQTFGERMSDRVAAFGGSWTFILGFVAVLIFWKLLNVTGLVFRPFDAYWTGAQLDEAAFPVLLAAKLREAGAPDLRGTNAHDPPGNPLRGAHCALRGHPVRRSDFIRSPIPGDPVTLPDLG